MKRSEIRGMNKLSARKKFAERCKWKQKEENRKNYYELLDRVRREWGLN